MVKRVRYKLPVNRTTHYITCFIPLTIPNKLIFFVARLNGIYGLWPIFLPLSKNISSAHALVAEGFLKFQVKNSALCVKKLYNIFCPIQSG